MDIRAPGSRCSKCRSTIGIIERAASASGVEVEIVKVENPDDVQGYGVQATPAVVIGGKVVHAGGLPSHAEVLERLRSAPVGFQPNRPGISFSRAKVGSARPRCRQRPR
jgi:arsenite-transporting ATPase